MASMTGTGFERIGIIPESKKGEFVRQARELGNSYTSAKRALFPAGSVMASEIWARILSAAARGFGA